MTGRSRRLSGRSGRLSGSSERLSGGSERLSGRPGRHVREVRTTVRKIRTTVRKFRTTVRKIRTTARKFRTSVRKARTSVRKARTSVRRVWTTLRRVWTTLRRVWTTFPLASGMTGKAASAWENRWPGRFLAGRGCGGHAVRPGVVGVPQHGVAGTTLGARPSPAAPPCSRPAGPVAPRIPRPCHRQLRDSRVGAGKGSPVVAVARPMGCGTPSVAGRGVPKSRYIIDIARVRGGRMGRGCGVARLGCVREKSCFGL